jgi:hypothetical protein
VGGTWDSNRLKKLNSVVRNIYKNVDKTIQLGAM